MTEFSFEEAVGGGERFVPPDVQAVRDVDRQRIVRAEFDGEADPDTKAALGRELERMQGGSPGVQARTAPAGAVGFEDAGGRSGVTFSFEDAVSEAGAGRGVQGGPQTTKQAQMRVPRRGGTRREADPFVAEEPAAPPLAGVADEGARLRDTFFSGVDNAYAGVQTLNFGAQAALLQRTQQKLQALESSGQGQSPEADGMRQTIAHYQRRMPMMAAGTAEAQADAQRGAAMVASPAVQAVTQAKTFGEAWDAFTQAPYEVISSITAQSLPTMLPGLVAGAVAGPAAGAMTMGASSGITEAGSSLGEFARNAGVDVTDPRALQAFFSEPSNLTAAMEYAGKRAGVIGAADAASGGVAGRVLAPAMRSGIARQAINAPAQMVVQGGMGAGGEAGAQLATKGRIDEPGQVFAEAVGEFGGAPGEVAALGREARRAAAERPLLRPTEQRKAINDRLDDFIATHGASETTAKAIEQVKKAAAARPLDEAPTIYKKFVAALARRGMFGNVTDADLAALDDPTAEQPGAFVRRGVDADGNPWEITPTGADYGHGPGSTTTDRPHGDADDAARTDRHSRGFGVGALGATDDGRGGARDVHRAGAGNPELAHGVAHAFHEAGPSQGLDEVRPALDTESTNALSARILTRAGRSMQTATPIELRPSADGLLTAYMDGKPMLASTGDPVTMPVGATDLQAKRAIRNAGALSDRINFYPPGRAAPGAATPRAAQPVIGDSVAIEGQAYTIEHTSKSAARLRDDRGRIRTVSFDSYAWATAQVEPPAPPQPAPKADRATFDTREAAERYLSDQRHAGGARQGRALPVATSDGRWTFARPGEPAFEKAAQEEHQATQRASRNTTTTAPKAQGDAQRERVLKALHKHMAEGGSLTTGLREAGTTLRADDKAAILDRSRNLRGEGKHAREAGRQAVEERIGDVLPKGALRERILLSLRDDLAAGDSLAKAFRKAGKALDADDKQAIYARAGALLSEGNSTGVAAKLAVEQYIGETLPDLVLREPGAEYTADHGKPDHDAERAREAESESSPRGQGEAASGRPAGAGLASVVAVRGSENPVRSRPHVVGLGIAADIERTGSAALVGRQVSGADQLAELAQVYRDPRYETFRVFFTKNEKIVHATGISARMPGYAPMAPAGMSKAEYVQWFKDQMQATGADGYYLLHNHPTGNPTPSSTDEALTLSLAAQVPGMKAHVVINSGKYAVISPMLDQRTEVLPIGEDALMKASKPHPLLGMELSSPAAVMSLGKTLQRDDSITLIGTDGAQRVRVIVEAPSNTLQRPNAALGAILRRTMRVSGSSGLFLVGSDSDIASAPVQRALAQGLLLDAVGATGRTQVERGARSGRGFQETKGSYVAEPQGGGRGANDDADRRTFEPAANAGRTLAHYRGMAQQALGRRQLVELYKGDIPQLSDYSDLVQRMDADKNDASAQADRIARDWAKLKDEQALARLMHDATIAGVDAAEDKPGPMRARFKALTPEAKAIYVRARDAYRKHFDDVQQAIAERIERADLSSERRQRLLTKLADNMKELTEGLYVPLARFGDLLVIVRNANGEAISVSRAETLNEADALRRSLVRQFKDRPGVTVGKVLKDKEFSAKAAGVSTGFLGELYQALEKEGVTEGLMDDIGQLYLKSLPDLSWAKHGIHRKNTPGFSQDARRAFASYIFHGASHLAKLRYADRLQSELDAMQKHVDAQADEADYDSVRAQQVIDEMVKRHDVLMNPKTHPVSTALTSLGFVFHLGLSPASAMVNLAQTPLVAYPLAGAKWGYAQAAAAFTKASADIVAGGGSLGKSLKGDEADAYAEAVRIGLIDVTQAHDLAGIAQGEDAKVSGALLPVMRVASWMFHKAEVINRETTFITGYRLARKAGADAKQALNEAVQFTYDSHFDYSASNRPRIMQGNWQRVILLFKQFAQNMIYLLARQAQQSLKGATPEARSQARKALAGLLVMHSAAAGVLGLPLVGTLLEAASMIGGDEDEPWDAETALRNMLADAFGQKPAEVLARGLSRLTPWDISGRVGLDRLILPDVYEGLEGQRAVEAWFASALGPVAGIAVNVGKGLQDIGEGRWLRGLEEMMPAALRGPMRGYRFATEGAQDRSGVAIVEEVERAAVIGQVLGLSPSAVRNAQEGRGAVIKADRVLSERRSKLIHDYARAELADDEKAMDRSNDAIDRWNDKQPEREIGMRDLNRSITARQRRIDEAEDGVYLPRSHRDALEAGRFAREKPDADDDEQNDDE